MTAVLETKDPAEAATSNRVSSINPRQDFKMNENTTSTAADAAPEKRSLKLQLIEIEDMTGSAASLIHALDMCIGDINDSRQRDALRTFADVIMDRMDELKDRIGAAREELA